MDTMGLSQEDQYNIFSLLAGILHLGNVLFGDKNNYATVLSERGMFFFFILLFIFNNILISSDLQAPCAYFGIQIDYLKTKLISKRLEFKEHEVNKQIDQTFTVDKATFTRDALAKAIYARIFEYLIQVKLNLFLLFFLN
jgi:myosin-1